MTPGISSPTFRGAGLTYRRMYRTKHRDHPAHDVAIEALRKHQQDKPRLPDPELMIRMLIVGYCLGIRSERRLCDEVHLNLAYRWFCRLGLAGRVPDHPTLSLNRNGRFRESDLSRDGRTPLRHAQGLDRAHLLLDKAAEECPHRDGAERARLQSDADHEQHRDSTAPSRDHGLTSLHARFIRR